MPWSTIVTILVVGALNYILFFRDWPGNGLGYSRSSVEHTPTNGRGEH